MACEIKLLVQLSMDKKRDIFLGTFLASSRLTAHEVGASLDGTPRLLPESMLPVYSWA